MANILGYKRARDAVQDHTSPDDRKALKYKDCAKSPRTEIAALWGENDFKDKILINESGLYCMIFGSKLESAQEFKLWVTKKVLPSIRTNGGYIMDQEYLSPDKMKFIAKGIAKLSAEVKELTASNAKYKKRWMSSVLKIES